MMKTNYFLLILSGLVKKLWYSVLLKERWWLMPKKRPAGDGLVRKRSDGRWEGRIIVGHKNNGTPIYRSVFAKKQGDLMSKFIELKVQFAGIELTEDSALTIGEWLDKWLEEYKKPVLRQSTYSRYLGDIQNHIKPHLGAKKLLQLKSYDVQKLYNKLCESGSLHEKKKGLSSATVRGIHNILHDALDCAMKEGVIASNPANGTSPPKIHRREKQVLTKKALNYLQQQT